MSVVTFPATRIPLHADLDERLDRICTAIHLSVADLMIEIMAAETVSDALQMRERIAECARSLDTMESAALDKADAILRQR